MTDFKDDVPVVFGKGPKTAKLMIIGEAPGAEEIAAKAPFVGRAGKLLTTMLSAAKIDRAETYITNAVKEPCRDGNKNRPPKRWEIEKWKELLWEELKSLTELKVIVTLGKVPTSLLLGLPATFKLGDYVGKRYNREYTKASIVPALHPSYLMQYGREHTENTVRLFKGIRKILEESNEKV
jgi:uracil-DNA glycosylase family 4